MNYRQKTDSAEPMEPATYLYDDQLPTESAKLIELLDGADLQQLFESFNAFVNIPLAIIDLHANVLLSSRWQRICTMFHRIHPMACSRCIENDRYLAIKLHEGKDWVTHQCSNGLTDCASPIIIEGKHVANLFVGQFLTSPPDMERFRKQAKEFAFDETAYLAALLEVPVVEEEKIPVILNLLVHITRLVTNLALDRKRALESQSRQAFILDTIPQSVFWKDIEGRYLGCNTAFARVAGLTQSEILGKTDFELPWPREDAEAYRIDDAVVISEKKARLHIIEPIQQADGSRIIADTSKVPLLDVEGAAPYGVLGVFEDITGQMRTEQELEQYRKNLEQMVESRTKELNLKNRQMEIESNERRLAQAALKESEEKYRTLINQSSSIVLEWDADGNVLYLNPYGLQFFGFSEEELIGRNVVGTIVAPLDSSGYNLEHKMIEVQRDPDKFYSSENENLRKNGEKVWVAWTNRGIYDSEGKLTMTISFGIDRTEVRVAEQRVHDQYLKLQREIEKRKEAEEKLLQSHAQLESRVIERTRELMLSNEKLMSEITERRRVEELLRENELKYRTLFETDDDAILLFTGNQWIDCNAAALRIFGCTRAEIIGRHPSGFSPPRQPDGSSSQELAAERISLAFENKPQSFEWVHCKVDGTLFDAEVHLNRVDLGGEPYIQAIVRDVSERKRAERVLRESEERFRTAFMTGVVAFIIMEEATGRLLEVNDHFLKLYGYSRDKVIGRTALELGMWAVPEARAQMLAEIKQHDQIENFEVLSQRKGGEKFWVLFSINRLNLEGSSLLLGAIHDISARKEAEDKVAEYVEQLTETFESTLQAIASMVEMRDLYTAGHERRVGLIAADIAREMGWSEVRCKQLQLIGLVHDIGKIAVPSDILTKPSKLSAIEFELVKTHAEKGYEILKEVKLTMPIGEIIRQHHERMDGSGYPHGLKGEEIMPEARILAVADALESMASHRPYRPTLGIDVAIKEIEYGRGTKFDEETVDTLISMIRDKGYQLPE